MAITSIKNPIKAARARTTKTQAELAELLGVSQQTIARWEGGDQVPAKHLRALGAILGTSVVDLLGAEEPQTTEERQQRAKDNRPWGRLELYFDHPTPEVPHSCPHSHCWPIDTGSAQFVSNLLHGFRPPRDGSLSWLQFETLNGRWVAVNMGLVLQARLIDDEQEAMPAFEPREVYKAAAQVVNDVVYESDALPTLEELDTPEGSFSRPILQRALELLRSYETVEEANNCLNRIALHVESGEVVHVSVDDAVVEELVRLESEDPAEGFFAVPWHEWPSRRLFRWRSIRLIDAPKLAMWDTTDEWEAEHLRVLG